MTRRMLVSRRTTRQARVVSYIRNYYLLMIACCWMCRVRFGLWQSSFQDLHSQLAQESQRNLFYPFRTRPALQQLIWAVNTSSYLMPGKIKCLAKALCAQAIARQFNYALDLHIGVAKRPNLSIEAHAWIVYQNRIILGNLPGLDKFVPLLLLPAQLSKGAV